MKKLLFITVSLLLFSCSSDDNEEEQNNGICDCVQTIRINEPNGGSLLYEEINNVETSCSKDGDVEEITLANGNIRKEEWDCETD